MSEVVASISFSIITVTSPYNPFWRVSGLGVQSTEFALSHGAPSLAPKVRKKEACDPEKPNS